VANWSELGGRDIPVVPIRVDAKAPGNEAEAAGSAGIAIEEAITLLRSVEGAVAMIPYPEAVRQGLPLLDILRRERGPNLTLRFLVEAPARSGQWGGISSIIVNTLFLILFTLLLSVPVGIGAGIFLVEYARQEKVVSVLRMGTETLAGIPSIVFGLFGNVFFVRVLGFGIGFVSSTLTVTLMILPTIVRTTEEALKAVPMTFREGSLAIGATRLQTLFRVVLPAASPGILTGIILAVGRTVGETAVLLYTLGSSYELRGGRHHRHGSSPSTSTCSFRRPYRRAAFATAAVLVLIVLAVTSDHASRGPDEPARGAVGAFQWKHIQPSRRYASAISTSSTER
jgi:phosphate transport system permease protein